MVVAVKVVRAYLLLREYDADDDGNEGPVLGEWTAAAVVTGDAPVAAFVAPGLLSILQAEVTK